MKSILNCMSFAEDLLKQSAEEIAREIGGGDPNSPTEYVRTAILNYKLQSRLVRATWYLVIGTWLLAAASLAIAYIK